MNCVVIESPEGRKALEQLAAERGVDGDRLVELLAVVASHSGMLRRRGMFQQFDAILNRATP